MQTTILNIAKSRSDNLVSEAEPVDCFYPTNPVVDPGHDSPDTLNPPPGLELQFASVESPAVESGLRLFRAKILTAAVLLGCLLVRCLTVLFDLEIRALELAHETGTRTQLAPK
jgi:hypothetical protein